MTIGHLVTAAPEKGAAFRSFVIKDVNELGGNSKYRRLAAPNRQMKAVHQRLIKCLRQLPFQQIAATGARKGHSPISNIAPHRGNRYFFLLDIKSAYETVDKYRLI